ncbi:MAG: hypothetical protein PHE83_02610 [Opitutaceae bacterium]|nr:hypothetical protein [Opitutaceae bacterium]
MTVISPWALSLGVLILALPRLPGSEPAPANPQMNPRPRAVLNYIAGLEHRTEKHMLSGQFANFGDNGILGILERIHHASPANRHGRGRTMKISASWHQ